MTAKSREQQELERLVDDADVDQRRVEQAVPAEERDPRDHADDVGGQERHGADQEQHHLHRRAADVEGEEIGDREADHGGQRPHDRGVAERVEVGPPGDVRTQRLLVVGEHEVGNDPGEIVVPEAHHHDRQDRDQQEHEQDQRQRCRLEIGGDAPPRSPPPSGGGRNGCRGRGVCARPRHRGGGGGGLAHEAMNSFHLETM